MLLLAFLIQPTTIKAALVDVDEVADEGYELVYRLPIPNSANFRNSNAIPYSVDNSASIGVYDRIAYYIELDSGTGSEFVYASMDAFTLDPTQIGLPHNVDNPVIFQQIVNNMNVVTNVPGKVTEGTGITTGNIEFWSTNYNGSNAIGIPGASGSQFDFGDGGAGIGTGHGSFQIHNHGAGETLFAYNDWGGNNPGGNSELGIGTNTGTVTTGGGPVTVGGRPDWTFADSTNLYTVKNIDVLVRTVETPNAPANIVLNAPEAGAGGFKLVYELNIPDQADFDTNGVPYAQDFSANIPLDSFKRVAYYLELDGPDGPQFVYVSMDPFTGDANLLGIPSPNDEAVFQQSVDNMTVISDVAGIVNGEGITTGNIEFWRTNYSPPNGAGVPNASGSLFDFGDTRSGGGSFGSFQIHNAGDLQTLLAYNNWNSNQQGGLGIGNNPNGHPDWTFVNNTGTYTVKNLFVLVQPIVPEPTTATLGLLGIVGLVARRRRTAA